MKRKHHYSCSSDSELDDNIEVEKSSGDENGNIHSPNDLMSPPRSTQTQARKRRRGIIEKRRRDRINSSLTELRRLVPSAFEKQGSSKLEKAEILQMTVDHLKMLHAAGGKGYFEAHSLAKDYRSLGFRECLAETACYLSIMEGRDETDPLRARLVSHLNSYASLRDVHTGLSGRSGLVAWSSAFGAPLAHLPHPLLLPHPRGQTPDTRSSPPAPSSSAPSSCSTGGPVTSRLPSAPVRVTPSSTLALGMSHLVPASKLPPIPHLISPDPALSAVPLSLSAFPLVSPVTIDPAGPSTSLRKQPHRPWGTEIGVF
ncbi:hypothetical protein DPEC_G00139140 [Dallia pectoralis]|uniref:Uncharacterized protein n=1 Tax=Dallia pectoralis TaxID=75939 RepID=A0ACC2GM30_DALPE|nr:hypothetical protein DPEC_G00139140 [Dallia pectoralis]